MLKVAGTFDRLRPDQIRSSATNASNGASSTNCIISKAWANRILEAMQVQITTRIDRVRELATAL